MSTLLLSTLRAHIVTAMKSGGVTLRDRVKTPAPEFPIHVLPYDLFDTEGLEVLTGVEVMLEPGMWIFSEEADVDEKWDANNLSALWLFEGKPDFWRHLANVEVSVGGDSTHLLGFISSGAGLAPWAFTCPRKMTVDTERDILDFYMEHSPVPDSEHLACMLGDMQLIGMLAARMALGKPVAQQSMRDFMFAGFGPLIDDMLGIIGEDGVDPRDNLLAVPRPVRNHLERVYQTINPMLDYGNIATQVMPIRGYDWRTFDSSVEGIERSPAAVSTLQVGTWVIAPLDASNTWQLPELVSFTFLQMDENYWDLFPEIQSAEYLICSVANFGGARPWLYHVPRKFLCHGAVPIDVTAKDRSVDMEGSAGVIAMEIAAIVRIGFLIGMNARDLAWGELNMIRMEAETPRDWMQDLINRAVPKGH